MLHSNQQKHIAVTVGVNLIVDLPPKLACFDHQRISRHPSALWFAAELPTEGLSNVGKNDTLPITVCFVSLLLNILQTLQISQVNTVKALSVTGSPCKTKRSIRLQIQYKGEDWRRHLPLGLHHILELKFNVRINRLHILI